MSFILPTAGRRCRRMRTPEYMEATGSKFMIEADRLRALCGGSPFSVAAVKSFSFPAPTFDTLPSTVPIEQTFS